MDDETKQSIAKIEQRLGTIETATQKSAAFGTKLSDLERQIKTDLLTDANSQRGVLWTQLKLLSGRNPSSKEPDDYELALTPTASDERWKLDVNERYQKAVGTVITLSTAALGSPIVFLKDIRANKSILEVLTLPAYMGAVLLAVSIVCAVVYYFFSAKWVKLALVNQADFFGVPIGKDAVEAVLDVTFFVMMLGFLFGVYFMLQFMATYVPK